MADAITIGFVGVPANVYKPATADGRVPGVTPSVRHAQHDDLILISIHHQDGTTLVAALTEDDLHDFAASLADRIAALPAAQPAHVGRLQ